MASDGRIPAGKEWDWWLETGVLVELAGSTLWPDCILGILSFVFTCLFAIIFCYFSLVLIHCLLLFLIAILPFSRSKIQQMLFRSTGREVWAAFGCMFNLCTSRFLHCWRRLGHQVHIGAAHAEAWLRSHFGVRGSVLHTEPIHDFTIFMFMPYCQAQWAHNACKSSAAASVQCSWENGTGWGPGFACVNISFPFLSSCFEEGIKIQWCKESCILIIVMHAQNSYVMLMFMPSIALDT